MANYIIAKNRPLVHTNLYVYIPGVSQQIDIINVEMNVNTSTLMPKNLRFTQNCKSYVFLFITTCFCSICLDQDATLEDNNAVLLPGDRLLLVAWKTPSWEEQVFPYTNLYHD